MLEFLFIIILIIGAYFLGNISPATFLAKASGHDIKSEGSGNAGATNVLRVVGKKAALLTLVVDVGKGYLAVFLGYKIMQHITLYDSTAVFISAWCGLAVFIGHVWPILLDFQGGKGVATALGALLAFDWKSALICLAIFAIVTALSKTVSLGSLIAAASFIVVYFLRFVIFTKAEIDGIDSFLLACRYILPFAIMIGILFYKHKENIKRLREGKENKLKF